MVNHREMLIDPQNLGGKTILRATRLELDPAPLGSRCKRNTPENTRRTTSNDVPVTVRSISHAQSEVLDGAPSQL